MSTGIWAAAVPLVPAEAQSQAPYEEADAAAVVDAVACTGAPKSGVVGKLHERRLTFNVLDDFNREALAIEIDTSLPNARLSNDRLNLCIGPSFLRSRPCAPARRVGARSCRYTHLAYSSYGRLPQAAVAGLKTPQGLPRRSSYRLLRSRNDRQIWLFTIYDKNETQDLTANQCRLLRNAISEELEARRGHV